MPSCINFLFSIWIESRCITSSILNLAEPSSEHLFLWTVSRGPRAVSGRTFIYFNQPSYRECLRPTDWVKPYLKTLDRTLIAHLSVLHTIHGDVVYVIHYFASSHALPVSIVITRVEILIKAMAWVSMPAVTCRGMWITKASSVVLKTKVSKTILGTAFGAAACQTIRDSDSHLVVFRRFGSYNFMKRTDYKRM